MSQPKPSEQPPKRPPFQFGMRGLLLVMFLVCIAATIFAGISKGGDDSEINGGFVIAAVVAPVGLMIVASVIYTVQTQLARRRKKRRPPTDDDD